MVLLIFIILAKVSQLISCDFDLWRLSVATEKLAPLL